MLTYIDIKNLATIETLQLELFAGTTVITGETGAGKSILIDAIELALGERATGDMIRPGCEKTEIALTFSLDALTDAKKWLQQHDLDHHDSDCIIRRILYRDGRSRSYINNTPHTLQSLRELGELLINTHGQHEHHSLFKATTQRDMLDRYAGHDDLVTQVATLANTHKTLSDQLKQLRHTSQHSQARCEFLQFQLQELTALRLSAGEFQQLEVEHKQLAHADELLQNMSMALNHLSENEEQTILGWLNKVTDALETVESVDAKVPGWLESIRNAHILLSDVDNDLRHHLEQVDLDPERLQIVENRISTLFDAARKHKTTPDKLIDLQHDIMTELSLLTTSDEQIIALEKLLQETEVEYHKTASTLSKSRQSFAKKIEKEITPILRELSLPHGRFSVELISEEKDQYPAHGLEKIVFQIATNIGQPLQPPAKVASGGELSRISLAIYMVTAEQHTTPTLIFDEVDVGISGGTAEVVGNLLRRLGETHQLLCITHQPQVAAKGHQHLLVEKHHDKQATYTRIQCLSEQDKIVELARMLGGVKMTEKTMAHAREMLGI